MHSKLKLWDFINQKKCLIGSSNSRMIALSTFDPLAFKFIKDSIDYSKFSDSKLHVISGKEVSLNWIEDNFKSLGLFGNDESFLIQHADEMNKQCKDLFIEDFENFHLDDRFLILNFNKEETLFKKLIKKETIQSYQIQAQAFWENLNLLNFLCDQLKVLLSFNAKSLILETVPPTIGEYFNLLTQISINFPDKSDIQVEDIRPLFTDSKIDNFELATLLGNKKISQFYKKISNLDCNYNDWRGIFYFLQSHMIKVYDTTYLNKKSKHSKYDKQILMQNGIWSQTDLRKIIDYFGDLELKAKTKDPLLSSIIQRDFLRTIIKY